jgi:UDP-glucose 4-epimerase
MLGATEKFGEDHRCETHLIPNVCTRSAAPQVEIYSTDYETPDGTASAITFTSSTFLCAHLALSARNSASIISARRH